MSGFPQEYSTLALFLNKACQKNGTFTVDSAALIARAVDTVAGKSTDPLSPKDVLDLYKQGLSAGQLAGAFNLQDVSEYYPLLVKIVKDGPVELPTPIKVMESVEVPAEQEIENKVEECLCSKCKDD
jgi:maltose-binding protein MalE